jgi:hypothetical protein
VSAFGAVKIATKVVAVAEAPSLLPPPPLLLFPLIADGGKNAAVAWDELGDSVAPAAGPLSMPTAAV